jgi:hypothetical protein
MLLKNREGKGGVKGLSSRGMGMSSRAVACAFLYVLYKVLCILLFVLYVYLYTSCQYIYIYRNVCMVTHRFLTRVQNHFDILNI